MNECFYNARCILKQLEPGTFLSYGRCVANACILAPREDQFTLLARDAIATIVRKGVPNAHLIEKALTSIKSYGEKDGQWIITSLQEKVTNDVSMTHIHAATAYATYAPEMTRLLVVYPDIYVDICVVFVRLK